MATAVRVMEGHIEEEGPKWGGGGGKGSVSRSRSYGLTPPTWLGQSLDFPSSRALFFRQEHILHFALFSI
jgi:hypothetical protein